MRYRVVIVAAFMLAFIGIAMAAPDCFTDSCIYIPVASGGNDATLTPTSGGRPTKTPVVAPSMTPTPKPVTLLPNGDFESGTTSWLPQVNASAIITSTLEAPVTPHSGTHAARLDAVQAGIGAELDSADIVVPPSTPYLSYWIWIRSTEPVCGDDLGGVGINPTTIDKFDFCAVTQTDHWVHHTLDLSAYAGQTVTVILGAGTFDNDASNSVFYVDDVGWQATP